MRYLRQFLWIIGFTLVGEALHALLPLPVPAAVWGLVLLFIAPAVGLMDSWPVLASVWPAVLAIIVLSTVVVFGVSGVVTQGILDFVSARADVEEPVMGQAEEVSDD